MRSPRPLPADWIPSGLVDAPTICLVREILRRATKASRAGNSALWLASEDHLSAALGIGPHADHFVGTFEQPLEHGIISLVYASGQPFCENSIADNPDHSPILDTKLHIRTDAMIAVPIAVMGEFSGVLTCVHTRPSDSGDPPAEFESSDLAEFEFAAACIGRILDAVLLTAG
jgi:hypothetical protein